MEPSGFKVDFRLIHDHEQLGKGLVSFEEYLPCSDKIKLCHDESKLLREVMISTETIYTWTIRISGLTAAFSTVLYDDEHKIYINIHQSTFYFSTCINELENLIDGLESLFKFKEDAERIANKVQKVSRHTERKNLRSEDFSPERKPSPILLAYFTLPRNESHCSALSFKSNAL